MVMASRERIGRALSWGARRGDQRVAGRANWRVTSVSSWWLGASRLVECMWWGAGGSLLPVLLLVEN